MLTDVIVEEKGGLSRTRDGARDRWTYYKGGTREGYTQSDLAAEWAAIKVKPDR